MHGSLFYFRGTGRQSRVPFLGVKFKAILSLEKDAFFCKPMLQCVAVWTIWCEEHIPLQTDQQTKPMLQCVAVWTICCEEHIPLQTDQQTKQINKLNLNFLPYTHVGKKCQQQLVALLHQRAVKLVALLCKRAVQLAALENCWKRECRPEIRGSFAQKSCKISGSVKSVETQVCMCVRVSMWLCVLGSVCLWVCLYFCVSVRVSCERHLTNDIVSTTCCYRHFFCK